jgi:hypothetical protein
MATLTPTLTLSSTNLTSDSLGLTVTDSLDIAGDFKSSKIIIATGTNNGVSIIPTSYNKCYVYAKNTDSSISFTLGPDNDGTADWMILAPGEWAFFPWDGSVELFANATSGTTAVLEYMIFEATA